LAFAIRLNSALAWKIFSPAILSQNDNVDCAYCSGSHLIKDWRMKKVIDPKAFSILIGVSVSFGSCYLQGVRSGKGYLPPHSTPFVTDTMKKISGEQSGEDCILPEGLLYFVKSTFDRIMGMIRAFIDLEF
jgi:hypothetical protein